MAGYKFDAREHVHTMDDKPLTGTSSVMSVVAKPLTFWAVGEGLKLLGWTPITEYVNGKRINIAKPKRVKASLEWIVNDGYNYLTKLDSNVGEEQATNWLKKLDEAYYAHSKTKDKAAKGGKDLHKELEDYIKVCLGEHGGHPFIVSGTDVPNRITDFSKWAVKNVEKFLWSEMHTYSTKHWLGGITDAGALMKDGKVAIIDFKSSKAAYASQFFQIGGYDIQISENGGFDSKGNKTQEPVKIDQHIIIPFGAPEFTVDIDDDTIGNRNAFLAALTLLRETQRHEE